MDGNVAPAQALSDEEDRLVTADPAIARLQRACGGELPGPIAIPELREVVRRSRLFGLRLARTIRAQDSAQVTTVWAEIQPADDEGGGCEITLRDWHCVPLPDEAPLALAQRQARVDHVLGELVVQLDAGQRVLSVNADAADLSRIEGIMRDGIGRPWTDFVDIAGNGHEQPLHWRLLDGVTLRVEGSARTWRARLFPRQRPGEAPHGFELCLISDEPPPLPAAACSDGNGQASADKPHLAFVGRDVAPVLRQPITRIIANAETIRARLAGPVDDVYAGYAADIATAGQHLLQLLDDLSTLEVMEGEGFAPAPDHIDLADVARQAAGILGVRARERDIAIDAPRLGESLPAIGEFRRVLQILLNLVGNAIRYAPAGSQVWIRLEGVTEGGKALARVTIADQGPGLAAQDRAKVFEKFERLGRSGDGGSGLGLYISRQLARAMGGELDVESAPGQGARFILDLPADMGAATAVEDLPQGQQAEPEPAPAEEANATSAPRADDDTERLHRLLPRIPRGLPVEDQH